MARCEAAIRVFAKINLFLRIVRRRDDGFHEILSVLHPIRLSDEIHVRAEGKGFHLDTQGIGSPTGEDNTVARAWALLRRERPRLAGGCRARLAKSIPAQAGLGGGSADGAGALLAMNRVFDAGLSREKLTELAAEIGSDTPFFLCGSPALASGRGECLSPFASALRGGVTLAVSTQGVSTAEAYARFTPEEAEPGPGQAEALMAAARSGDLPGVAARLHNTFERLIFPVRPELQTIKQRMLESGAMGALLTGSGATVFGLGFQATRARRLEAEIPPERGSLILTEFHSATYEWLA